MSDESFSPSHSICFWNQGSRTPSVGQIVGPKTRMVNIYISLIKIFIAYYSTIQIYTNQRNRSYDAPFQSYSDFSVTSDRWPSRWDHCTFSCTVSFRSMPSELPSASTEHPGSCAVACHVVPWQQSKHEESLGINGWDEVKIYRKP